MKPSMSEPGYGHAWLPTYRRCPTGTPTSSATSRTTAASHDSPASTNPARHEYRRSQSGPVHAALWPSRHRPSSPPTPSCTSTITAGSVRGHTVRPLSVTRAQPASTIRVGEPS